MFAANGYNGTSLAMLTEAAGLGKQSLYNAFGDKRALYLQSMDCYASRVSALRSAMVAAPTGRAAIELMLTEMLTACTSPDPAVHTCMMSAGLLESIDDEGVAKGLRELWNASDRLLRETLERGQHDGSVRSDIKAQELSRLLMTLMSGLRVTARVVNRPRQLRAVAEIGLKFLERPD